MALLTTCSDGQYSATENWGDCKDCPAGQYRYWSTWNYFNGGLGNIDANCLECLSNKANDDHTACDFCPVGKWANEGCDDCPWGRYQDVEGMDECKECGAERHVSSDRTSCVCPAGQEPNFGIMGTEQETCKSCPADMVSAEDQKMCHKCPPGRAPDDAQDGCNSCGRHEISDGLKCILCDSGRYPNHDHTDCLGCHEGEVTVSHGCQKCDPPQVPNPGRTECVTCHPPKFAQKDSCGKCTGSRFIKGEDCVPCPVGAIPNHDHTDCHQCHGNEVPTDHGLHCHVCPENQIPTDSRSGCRSCANDEVPASNSTKCQKCTGATVPSSDGVRCEPCPLSKYALNNQECHRCKLGMIPSHDQTDCIDCDPLEVVSEDGKECECKGGYFRSGDSCEQCSGDTISSPDKLKCVSCQRGTEADIDHIHCQVFDRANFLMAQAPLFGPLLLIFLGAVFILHLVLQRHKPEGYEILGEETAKARELGKSKIWRVFGREPIAWPGWLLGSWDLVDWAIYVGWFVSGKPAAEQSAEFQDDKMVSLVCSALIWFGGFLPALMWVLPRGWYVSIESIYDLLEVGTIAYVSHVYGFKIRSSGQTTQTNQLSLLLTIINCAATAIDVMVFKGPEALDSSLAIFSCCVNIKLKETELTDDVEEGELELPMAIEGWLVFQKNDDILINDDEHQVITTLTRGIVVKPGMRRRHERGSTVRLSARDGKPVGGESQLTYVAVAAADPAVSAAAGAATAAAAAADAASNTDAKERRRLCLATQDE